MAAVCTVGHPSLLDQCQGHAAPARKPLGTPGVFRPVCQELPSLSPAPSCRAADSRNLRSQHLDVCAQSSPSQGGSAPLHIPTTAGVTTPSLDYAARRQSTISLYLS